MALPTFTTENSSEEIIKAMLDDLDIKLKAMRAEIEMNKPRGSSEDNKDENCIIRE